MANQLTNVKGLEKLTELYALGLGGNQLTSVKGLEKLTKLPSLDLTNNQLTDVKGLEKLTKLTRLGLDENPALTKAQIDELKKALPKCKITHDATKEDGRPKPKVGIRMGSDGLAYLESGNTLYTGQMMYTDEKKGFVRTMNFRKGKLHGILSQKYPDGRKFGEAHYVDGVKHGDSIKWYPNGQKQQHRIYFRGRIILNCRRCIAKNWQDGLSNLRSMVGERKLIEQLVARALGIEGGLTKGKGIDPDEKWGHF